MRYIYIFLLCLPLLSQSQEVLTLEKAISIGLENNFQIKIDEQFIQIAENNNSWARAGRVPTIDLRGTFNNNLINDNNPASFLNGTYYTGNLGASLETSWVVYNGGRVRINKEQLNLAVEQERLNKETNINALLRNIYQQYYEVIFQQEQLLVLEEVLELSKDRLAYEESKRSFGASNSYNLVQFRSSVLADSNSLVTQTRLVERAKQTLYTTLDFDSTANYRFEERLSILAEEIDEDRLKASMQEENYTLKSLQLLATLNQLNTGLAKAARKPVISLTGSIGFSENAFQFFADDPNTGEPFPFIFANRSTGSFGASFLYNLYDGGVRSKDVQNAELQEQIDQLSILEARAELNNQLDILIDNYENQLEVLALTDQQIQLAAENLKLTEERFKTGQLTSLDYRNVQNQYLNASFNKVGAIYTLLITKSEIDFLVGVFGE
jgi:outer membrane protein